MLCAFDIVILIPGQLLSATKEVKIYCVCFLFILSLSLQQSTTVTISYLNLTISHLTHT